MKKITFFYVIYVLSKVISAILASDYYVKDLPRIPENSAQKIHSGYITVDEKNDGTIFFFLAENKYLVDKSRTLIWLNGGPGCSSMDGVFLENGPFSMTQKGALVENQGAWNEFSNFLAVDQPFGTGYSYSDSNRIPYGLSEVSKVFVSFLDRFFEKFPQYEEDDLYISGESFAGQYIPYIASYILNRNKEENSKHYNLKGIIIGNGWIDPFHQFRSYLPFSLQNNLIKKGSQQHRKMEEAIKQCEAIINKEDKDIYPLCENVIEIIIKPEYRENKKCLNMYDYRLESPSCDFVWPRGQDKLTSYLRESNVMSALNVKKDIVWSECSSNVFNQFLRSSSPPSIHLLPEILSEIPVLLYSGNKDIICNHMGTEDMINNMEWNGRKGFIREDGTWAPKYSWIFMENHVGYYQNDRNLTYVLIKDASHMVPYDKPLETQDMINRFFGIDPKVIMEVRRANAERIALTGIITVEGNLDDLKKVLKVKRVWISYFHLSVFILIFMLVGVAWFLWRFFKNRRKSDDNYSEKYEPDDNDYHLENGSNYDNKRYSNSFRHKDNYDGYNASISTLSNYKKSHMPSGIDESPVSSYLHTPRNN